MQEQNQRLLISRVASFLERHSKSKLRDKSGLGSHWIDEAGLNEVDQVARRAPPANGAAQRPWASPALDPGYTARGARDGAPQRD